MACDSTDVPSEQGTTGYGGHDGPGIVVGYDGSPDAEEAVAWAAREARARALVLTVCLALAPPYPAPPTAGQADARRMAEEALAPGLRLARELIGERAVRPMLATGTPAAVLCAQCPDAAMVVVGSRGRDTIAETPVGPVSSQVAAYAPGRVVVVRGHWRPVPDHPPRPIAVGVDGSPGSAAAAAFAFEEAALRPAPVLAVCALADNPGILGTAARVRQDFEQVVTRCERCYPGVAVRRKISEGTARRALLDAAAGAQLAVAGARGRGGVPGMSLGSAGLALLAYAPCPVAIFREDRPR